MNSKNSFSLYAKTAIIDCTCQLSLVPWPNQRYRRRYRPPFLYRRTQSHNRNFKNIFGSSSCSICQMTSSMTSQGGVFLVMADMRKWLNEILQHELDIFYHIVWYCEDVSMLNEGYAHVLLLDPQIVTTQRCFPCNKYLFQCKLVYLPQAQDINILNPPICHWDIFSLTLSFDLL